jgi:hypothetical protein
VSPWCGKKSKSPRRGRQPERPKKAIPHSNAERRNEKTIKGEHYTLLFLKKRHMFFKLEFVNDVAPHFGDFENISVLGRITDYMI